MLHLLVEFALEVYWFFMLNGCLYISYDGILEPLGQSQVLSYLEGLSNKRKIYLISFEKSTDR